MTLNSKVYENIDRSECWRLQEKNMATLNNEIYTKGLRVTVSEMLQEKKYYDTKQRRENAPRV